MTGEGVTRGSEMLSLLIAAEEADAFVADGVLAEVVLPLCIVFIMISMGMTLTGDDFRRVLSSPKQVGVGLVCQLILLPVLGFAIAAIFFDATEAVFAVSIVLLAAAPGGTTSNLIVHATEGDRALSVSLTSFSNAVVWITMPILLTVAFDVFDFGADSVEFPLVDLVISVAALTIVPVVIGMALRRWAPDFCERMQGPSKVFASAFLIIIVTALVITNWSVVADNAPKFAPAFIVLNLIALAVGFGVAKAAGLTRQQASTIGVETGLQNSTLALTIATSVLGNSEMAIIPGLYGVWMLFTGFAFAFALKDSEPAAAAAV